MKSFRERCLEYLTFVLAFVLLSLGCAKTGDSEPVLREPDTVLGEAITYYKELMEDDPRKVSMVREKLVKACLLNGEEEIARELISDNEFVKDVDAYIFDALLPFRKKTPEPSKEYYSSAMTTASHEFARQKEHEPAIKYAEFEAAGKGSFRLPTVESKVDSLQMLAQIQFGIKDWNGLEKTLSRTLELDSSAETAAWVSRFYQSVGKIEQARELLKHYLSQPIQEKTQQFPGERYELYDSWISVALRLKDKDSATKLLGLMMDELENSANSRVVKEKTVYFLFRGAEVAYLRDEKENARVLLDEAYEKDVVDDDSEPLPLARDGSKTKLNSRYPSGKNYSKYQVFRIQLKGEDLEAAMETYKSIPFSAAKCFAIRFAVKHYHEGNDAEEVEKWLIKLEEVAQSEMDAVSETVVAGYLTSTYKAVGRTDLAKKYYERIEPRLSKNGNDQVKFELVIQLIEFELYEDARRVSNMIGDLSQKLSSHSRIAFESERYRWTKRNKQP